MHLVQKFSLSVVVLAFLNCCAAYNAKLPQSWTPEEFINDARVFSMPFEVVGEGLFVVEVGINGLESRQFVVDTGATKSAIYRDTLKKLDLTSVINSQVNIHGMTTVAPKPQAQLMHVRLGTLEINNLDVVVLDKDRLIGEDTFQADGIIGMDILRNYRIYVDGDTSTFHLIPSFLPAVEIPIDWRFVELKPNPYLETDHGLHFIELRIGNRLIPALLDTGSEFNIISWDSLHFPQLRSMKRRMREDWLIKGAVGEFDPVSQVNVENFRGGQKWWEHRVFYVMNFENLEILGVDQKPFVIAGGNLLAGNSFYLDFDQAQLFVRPEKFDRQLNLRRYGGIVIQNE